MLDYLFHRFKEQFKFENDKEKADKVVESAVTWSMGAGLIPIPVADIVAVTSVQIVMVRQLAETYKVDYNEANLKSWLTALSGGVLPKLGAGFIKMIPGIGSIIGGVSMAILSGGSTYASGKTFIKHFETGGTLEDFDVESFKGFYKEQFEKGKDFADKMKGEAKKSKFYKNYVEWEEVDESENNTKQDTSQANPKASEDSFQRLKQLVNLKNEGVISESEFDVLKKKLMDNL